MLARVSTYEQDNAQSATELRDTTKTLVKLPSVEKTNQGPCGILGTGGGQLGRCYNNHHRADDHKRKTLQLLSVDEPREERDNFTENAIQGLRTQKTVNADLLQLRSARTQGSALQTERSRTRRRRVPIRTSGTDSPSSAHAN